MTESELQLALEAQRAHFAAGATMPADARVDALQKLLHLIDENEAALCEALRADLGKSAAESFMCEVGLTRSEVTWLLRHVRRLARPRRVHTPLAQFAAVSYESPMPFGTTLIMSPWNYPVLLTLEPLADALAAGNTAVVKPSAYAPATSALLKTLLEKTFPPQLVFVVTGGRAENQALLAQKFDFIFFTGGKAVGREVLHHAADHLTPVVLELGGKSPCIVDETANLPLAAKRIVFGKFVNCGQTCVAPDYVYCAESVRDALVAELAKQMRLQFGEKPLLNAQYGKLINEKHFARVRALIDPAKVVCGGEADEAALRLAPTLMQDVTFGDAVMGEEIFGPVLPVLTWKTLDEAIRKVESLPHPLALYLFSENRDNIRRVHARCRFGGGCVNDVVIHLATSAMGFGGVGESGMGQYHGRVGFETFTHRRSIVDKKTWMDMPVRYAPYTEKKAKLLRLFLK